MDCKSFGITKKEYAQVYHSIKFMMVDNTIKVWENSEVSRLYLCLLTEIHPMRNNVDIKLKLFCACMYLKHYDLANRLLEDENHNKINEELVKRIRKTKTGD